MGGLLRKFRKRGPIHPFAKNMVKWLRLFAIDNTAMGVLLIALLTILFIPNEIRFIMLSGFLFFGLLTANFFLFFKPEILYGIPQPLPDSPDVSQYEEKGVEGTEKEILSGGDDLAEMPRFILEYRGKIDSFLFESKRYLDPFFNLQDLARETGFPKHHLHLLIHKAENKSFVDFINGYRILHIKQLIENGELSNKTLEALAADSGFPSRATFYRTIKKTTGETPKNYFAGNM
jgi:AraC-like DNA-binding protein